MPLNLSRRGFLAGTAASSTLLLARPGLAQEPLKAAWVYVGPVGDFGYSYQHDLGRKDVAEHYGDKVQTSFVEKVAEGPDADRVIRQLATSGNQLIFATSFGFMNSAVRVAKQFPKVKFEHATGYQTGPNLAVYNARFYEGRAVIGTIAGLMTKSGVIGYIASFPIPEVVMGINAFTLAAQKHRPDIQIKVVWVNSWYDPGKEADAAKALIDQGADIIAQHTDSPAALQVAEDRGMHAFGQSSDMRNFAPKAQLSAIVDDWGPYYIDEVKAVLDGTWKAHNVWLGLKEGMVVIAPYGPDVPPEVAQAADQVKEGIIAGTLHPFDGPVSNQAGEVVIAEGERASDEQMQKMDWYVKGVQA
jgi:basic membrane protein A and related proteins